MSYSKQVIDHFENPRNVGSLDQNSSNVGTGLVGAPACGDVMKLQLKINEAGIIEDAKFKTFGCGSAIASSSLITTMLKGMTVTEAETIKNIDVAHELQLPPVKIHCSVLAEDAIKAAIRDWKSKRE
jgi:nitrogen fixation NifU-like protein